MSKAFLQLTPFRCHKSQANSQGHPPLRAWERHGSQDPDVEASDGRQKYIEPIPASQELFELQILESALLATRVESKEVNDFGGESKKTPRKA